MEVQPTEIPPLKSLRNTGRSICIRSEATLRQPSTALAPDEKPYGDRRGGGLGGGRVTQAFFIHRKNGF
jgi:hypothetical protein